MGIASMVIGIISAILGVIPLCGNIAFLPALIGLVLGIVDIVIKAKNQQPKGQAIAGVVLCSISLIIIIFFNFVIAVGASA